MMKRICSSKKIIIGLNPTGHNIMRQTVTRARTAANTASVSVWLSCCQCPWLYRNRWLSSLDLNDFSDWKFLVSWGSRFDPYQWCRHSEGTSSKVCCSRDDDEVTARGRSQSTSATDSWHNLGLSGKIYLARSLAEKWKLGNIFQSIKNDLSNTVTLLAKCYWGKDSSNKNVFR